MEHYYFLEINGTKQGPYKLSELKSQAINRNQLVWRSDGDTWKNAIDFEELSEMCIKTPPPTPNELNVIKLNQHFLSKIVKNMVIAYFISSLVIGFISFTIAQSAWDKYIKDTDGKYLGYNRNYQSSGFISLYELNANKRYPHYVPNYDNEDAYALGEKFLFRPFKAFYSTIYLTVRERNNSGTFLGNLILSSYISLLLIFIPGGLLYYLIRLQMIKN